MTDSAGRSEAKTGARILWMRSTSEVHTDGLDPIFISVVMKRVSLISKDRGQMTRRGIQAKGKQTSSAMNEKTSSTPQTKASRLLKRITSLSKSHSAPALTNKDLKRSRSSSLRDDSPAAKRQKLESGANRERTRRTNFPDASNMTLNDKERKKIAEMKKLVTTDGFWASSTAVSGLESSHLSKRAASIKRTSNGTNAEVSPASTTRKKLANNATSSSAGTSQAILPKVEKEGGASVPISELRRLQTSGGFWSSNLSLTGLRSDSRDGSPSSTSSLERSSRQSSRSSQRINPPAESSGLSSDQQADTRSKNKAQSLLNSLNRKIDQRSSNIKKSRVLHTGHLKSRDFIGRKRIRHGLDKGKADVSGLLKVDRFRDSTRRSSRNKLQVNESLEQDKSPPLSKEKEPLHKDLPVREKRIDLKNSKVSHKEDNEDNTDEKQSRCNVESPKNSIALASEKSFSHPLQKKAISSVRQTRLKVVGNDKELGDEKEALALKDISETSNELLSTRSHSISASRLAISDLLASGELKRLDTTPGFWAPTPDVSHVLGLAYLKRASNFRTRSIRHRNSSLHQLSPKKPESSLLQLRKKKLNAMQKQRQIKQQASRGQERMQLDPLQHQTLVEKHKKKKFVYGRKKKKYKKKKDLLPAPKSAVSDTDMKSDEKECDCTTEDVSKDLKTQFEEITGSSSNELQEKPDCAGTVKDSSEKEAITLQGGCEHDSVETESKDENLDKPKEFTESLGAKGQSPQHDEKSDLPFKNEEGKVESEVSALKEDDISESISLLPDPNSSFKEEISIKDHDVKNPAEIITTKEDKNMNLSSEADCMQLEPNTDNPAFKLMNSPVSSSLDSSFNLTSKEENSSETKQDVSNSDLATENHDASDEIALSSMEKKTSLILKSDGEVITSSNIPSENVESAKSDLPLSIDQKNETDLAIDIPTADEKQKEIAESLYPEQPLVVPNSEASASVKPLQNSQESVSIEDNVDEIKTVSKNDAGSVLDEHSPSNKTSLLFKDTNVDTSKTGVFSQEDELDKGSEEVGKSLTEVDPSKKDENPVAVEPENFQDSEATEAQTNPVSTDAPIVTQKKHYQCKRITKRRRNAWKRGVVQKATKMYRQIVKKSDVTPELCIQKTEDKVSPEGGSVQQHTDPKTAESQILMNTIRAAKKSAKEKRFAMLRRLQTDANLASGIIDESTLQSRFLRDASHKNKSGTVVIKESMLGADTITSSHKIKSHASERGLGQPRRPSKRPKSNLPKLTLSAQPVTRKSWYDNPPTLSPHCIETMENPADDSYENGWRSQDGEFVSESVDESDLHLYLSGVSDEEPSPAKCVSDSDFGYSYKDVELVNENYDTKKQSKCQDSSASTEEQSQIKLQTISAPDKFAAQPQQFHMTKIKGKKGCPPGTPMTEEEKIKVRCDLISRYDDYANFKMPRTARKSTFTPSLYLTSPSPSSAKKFSLRQKTTRSPLEMLEMKRKQEEAIYDMEEERRLAKRINRLEKRFSQASCDGLSGDECDYVDMEIKECSVILNDFVKKLHLESIDLTTGTDDPTEEHSRPETPDNAQDNVEEDWCANLEDFQEDDQEWTAECQQDKRPFIPRLKLKRIPKQGKEKKAKGHKSKKKAKFVCPEQNIQQPLKLVIKTEMLSSCSNAKPSSTVVDVSKVHRQGFEGSFVDFLQGRTSDNYLLSPRKVHSAPKHIRSGPKQTSDQSNVASHVEKKATDKSANGNESLFIMNLGDVGGLKSRSQSSVSCTENVLATSSNIIHPPSKQGSAVNDEMGAMQSFYNQNRNEEGDRQGFPLEQVEQASDGDVEEKSSNSKSMVENDLPSTNISDANQQSCASEGLEAFLTEKDTARIDQSAPSEVGSTTVSVARNKDGTVESSNNNNIISMPSSKHGHQTSFKSVSPTKENDVQNPNCSALCTCPEGWRVKIIQLADKQMTEKRFTCRRCSFASPAQLTMESHIYSHIPGVQFRCAYCESEFSSMAATASHMKNTHQLSEACLYISRHVEEQNFYDSEALAATEINKDTDRGNERVMGSPRGGTQVAGSVVVSSGDGLGQGGKSPPVVISVLVSNGAAATGGSNHAGGVMVRPGIVGPNSSNRRRYVCTHCGFSTNIRADAEHHVSDLHPESSVFACSLCKENNFYSDAEIRQHAATVHPSRFRPYRRLPDFYDAEKLSAAASSEGSGVAGSSGVVFEMTSSVFQDNHMADESGPVDHRQRAKDYLYLQEGLKEKRSAEADSTTAVDYPDCETELPQSVTDTTSSMPEETEAENCQDKSKQTTASTEIFTAGELPRAVHEDSLSDITSSAVCSTEMEKNAGNTDEHGHESNAEAIPGAQVVSADEDASASSGLKIVQVVSLSNADKFQEEEKVPDEQAGKGESALLDRPLDEAAVSEQTASPPQQTSTSASSSSLAVISSVETSLPCASSPKQSTTAISSPSLPTSSHARMQGPSSSAAVAAPNQPAGGLPLSYKCSACRVHTPYLLMMVKHLKAKHPHMGCFSCPYCKISTTSSLAGVPSSQPESFVTQKQLRSHIRKNHPDKTGRNEIALSAKAKQFVEAMVLPAGPECIRVGSRLVLEEDIHTCTYCSLKMTSLASVYEHLNEAHGDLFEFVCPVCQSFKSKDLEEISQHSLTVHRSEVETDKVHVSVPKNLFSVLKCISKGGKYIEKQLDNANSSCPETSNSSKATSIATTKDSTGSLPAATSPAIAKVSAPTVGVEDGTSAPLDLTSCAQQTVSPASDAPAIPAPVVPAPPAHMTIKSPARVPGSASFDPPRPAQVNFSSSLFDTSSLTAPPQLVVSPSAGNNSNAVPAAAALSFLSPQQQKSLASGKSQLDLSTAMTQMSMQNNMGNKQAKSSPSNSSKYLPVLNVPTIRPRQSPASSLVTRREAPMKNKPHQSSATKDSRGPVIAHTSAVAPSWSQLHRSIQNKLPSAFEDLPDNEPNPDAFKIFNLQPMPPHTNSPNTFGPLHSPSPSGPAPLSTPSVIPSVFPPVSTPLNAGFIPGPIVGFPAGMVISQALLPPHAPSYSFSQQQHTFMQSASPVSSGPSIFSTAESHGSNSSSSSLGQMQYDGTPSPSFISSQRPKSTADKTALLKEKQQLELMLLKQQHQQQQRGNSGQLPKDPHQQLKVKQKLLRLQQLQQFQRKRQEQQMAHRQEMFQRAVLNQQQQARLLAQHAQIREQRPMSASPQAWVHNKQHNQLQQSQETALQSGDDFSTANAHPIHGMSAESSSLLSPLTARPSSVSSVTSLSSSSASASIVSPRPTKGVHKRSSSLYQCPYCPTPLTLKALEVASHIQQKHPGKQVTFKKAAV
ncbi:hypothetical protein PoB_003702200 [Plakobranchus ocellatus]|uniref:C2H2-type domain-containing protein n=1 Tax=Plakobranchus ocellatus TaxID=259542 RepID=A0AAV4AUA3_9GAST|nr:hypothetical protein PoB_003702200 [Plakobranchus ocellatus]